MKNRIIVTRRSHDYHACVEGFPEKWASGRTVEEAADNVAGTWRTEFTGSIEIVLDYTPRALRASAEGWAT